MILKLSDHPDAREESIGEHRITSRSGLSLTEKLLLQNLDHVGARVLIIENRSGVLGQILEEEGRTVVQHSHDDFFHRQLLERWPDSSVRFELGAELNKGPFDEVFIQVSQSLSAEMFNDLLQEAHGILVEKGKCRVAVEGRHSTADDALKRVFGSFTTVQNKKGKVLIARKVTPLKKRRNFTARYEVKCRDGRVLEMESIPGVFSHRRLDGGAHALAWEVELEGKEKVLELGCGGGVVGISLKAQHPDIELTMVDSHSRAVLCTCNNLDRLGWQATVHLSSSGCPEDGPFDVVVGNPPYFGDHRISALFIDEAARVLRPGGSLWLVAKSMEWNREYASTAFENFEESRRGPYRVLRCFRKS